MQHWKQFTLGSLAAITLSACGGGGSSSNSDDDGSSDSQPRGDITLAITDAPVTDAKNVIVGFSHIQLKHKDRDPVTLAINEDESPVVIDLLSLTGSQQEVLIDTARVHSGEYEWVRFLIDEDLSEIVFEGATDSDDDDISHDLDVPSDKLRLIGGFTVPTNGEVSYIIDFDLRHSIVNNGGNYKLKPVLRMEDLSEVGHIAGTISNACFDACALVNADENNVVVNLFEDIYDVDSFDDSDAAAPEGQTNDDDAAEPLTSAIVSAEPGDHSFEIGFVTAGDYKVVLTCGTDDPEADDDDNAELEFQAWAEATVIADETTDLINGDFTAIP